MTIEIVIHFFREAPFFEICCFSMGIAKIALDHPPRKVP